ncbi:MAG TPA: hypothetical protein VLG11_00645 [Candidatus Saccharimonadales bacterium]|nr:hypothetical protein [Candidatus Saccharimonadales bacterium]
MAPPRAYATAGINSQISFQGKVVKSDGTNIADGTYNVEFKIYQDGTGTGGGTLKWTEDRLVGSTGGVSLTSGTFQVNLGSVTALSGVDFNQNTLWLSIQVGNASTCTITTSFQTNCGGDGEMSPYIRMTATPYALNAGLLGGLAVTSLVQLSPGSQQTGAINVQGTINSASSLQTAGSTRIDASGNVTALGITATGNTLLQPSSASSAAFVVQASGPLAILTADTSANKVQIGSATSDTTQVNLQLDSSNTFADTGTCTTSSNQGGLYYNTVTNTVRSCVNGNWEDLTSTGGLGLLAYGVLPDSPNAGSVGDLAGITQSNSPCKVYWASATSVTVAPCIAYSGGRKVIVTSTTLSTASVPASDFVNVCLSGTNNQPALVGTGTTTDAASTQPTWSANNPVLCLATLQMSTTAGTITGGKIYDTRTFTTTQKTFGTLNTAMGLGTAVVQSGTANILGAPSAAAAAFVRGIIVAYSGALSTTTANVIIATSGPQWVKGTGTSTVAQYAQVGATSGYISSTTTVPTTTAYSLLGTDTRTIDTTCTSNATCQYSQFLNPLVLR